MNTNITTANTRDLSRFDIAIGLPKMNFRHATLHTKKLMFFHLRHDFETQKDLVLLIGPTVSAQDLSKLPASVKWNFFSHANSAFVFDWQTQPLVPKNTISFGSIDATKKQAKYLIGHQTKTVLVFADSNGNLLYHLNIGKLCSDLPTYFNNMTESNKTCSQMTESHLDSAMKEFCSEKEAELLGYVKEGLLRCEVAAKNFDDAGCGRLRCE